MPENVRVYLGVGSNINAKENIDKALRQLEDLFGAVDCSPIYQNPAQGFTGDDFLNLVVRFEYGGELAELRDGLRQIEEYCGRQRQHEVGKGSRTIDLDLLLFGNLEGEHQGFQLPRPDIFSRQFVWQPLLDLFADEGAITEFEKQIQASILAKSSTTKPLNMRAIT